MIISKYPLGMIIATNDQMKEAGIIDVPPGAVVEVSEIDQHNTGMGKGSKIRYESKEFDYILPSRWIYIFPTNQ